MKFRKPLIILIASLAIVAVVVFVNPGRSYLQQKYLNGATVSDDLSWNDLRNIRQIVNSNESDPKYVHIGVQRIATGAKVFYVYTVLNMYIIQRDGQMWRLESAGPYNP